MHDVYLYGMISPSTVYVLDEGFPFPQPNQYAEIKQQMPSIGGEAVNSAIILSKLGVKTKLDGIWINQKKSETVFQLLKPFDIDCSRITVKPDVGTEEIVISDTHARTIFGNYAKFHSGSKQWNTPQEIDIQESAMVVLDPYFKDESLHIAQLCVSNKKPYITHDCKYDDYIAQHAGAVIISHELRDQAYRDCDMVEVFQRYQQHCHGFIIFTFGSDDIWYARRGETVQKFSPYHITPIDTAGAGDSFRGGVAYGLLNGWDDAATIAFASAVAACVCLTTPHALNAPGKEGIVKFMQEQSKPQL